MLLVGESEVEVAAAAGPTAREAGAECPDGRTKGGAGEVIRPVPATAAFEPSVEVVVLAQAVLEHGGVAATVGVVPSDDGPPVPAPPVTKIR
jgi:hypothetical protein